MANGKKMEHGELLALAMDAVWNDQGIDSYGLLAKLLEAGWKYDGKTFRSVLSSVRCHGEIACSERSDGMMRFRPLEVTAKLPSLSRRCNCYNCGFLQDRGYDYRLKTLFEAEISRGEREERLCALDPTLRIRLGMDSIPEKCPVNLAIAKRAEAIKAAEEAEGKEEAS